MRVFVKITGGVVQGIVTDSDEIAVTILDYDCESSDPDEKYLIPEQDGGQELAWVYEEPPLVDAEYCDEIEASIENGADTEEDEE